MLINKQNYQQWPKVVSDDVLKHVFNLKNRVYVVSGQVKGKTLLPFSVRTDTGDSSIDSISDTYDVLVVIYFDCIQCFSVTLQYCLLYH